MKKTLRQHLHTKYILSLIAGVVFFVLIFLAHSVWADTATQYKASGFAFGGINDNGTNTNFSGNDTGIGYISFGCESDVGSACDDTATTSFPSGYGVRINTNPDSSDYGKFFGYAWSSNYGWVSFYHNDVSSCGAGGGLEISGDVQNFINTEGSSQVLNGYARVLNSDSSWDGCIRFSGSTDDGDSYATEIETAGSNLELSGWAWGSDVVGWVSFSCEYCRVVFEPVDEECPEADDSEECAPVEEGGLALYVGGPEDSPTQIIGNSTYQLGAEDIDSTQTVKLIPQAFGQAVDSCTASSSSSQGATTSGWNGSLPYPGLNPLEPNVLSNQFIVSISGYSINEIITFTINCLTVDGDSPVSAQAFVTIVLPQAEVSISASPNPINTTLDPNAATTLSWDFDNVQDDSCTIIGAIDFFPSVPGPLTPLNNDSAGTIQFSTANFSPNNPGTDELSGITFPVWFQITCLDFGGQEVSDSVYITTTDLGCTENMEAAGYCTDAISPIFEEF